MRTSSYTYHVARRDALAFGGELDVSHWDRFSAESEDACALHDALTVYGEQAERDARVGVSDGLYSLTEDVKDRIQWFAGHPDGENPEAVY